MISALRSIGIVSRVTLLESIRRQGFLVLLLVSLALLLGATALARFDAQVQRKVLANLCLGAIFLMSSLITVTTIVPLLPGEVEQRTLYPVIAKAVPRWQFVFGKYLGGMATVAAGMLAMTAAVALLERLSVGRVDAALGFVVPFYFLEAAVLGAVALWLSTFLSAPMAWFLSLLVCLLGNVKTALYTTLMGQPQPIWNKATISVVYALLPDLASFNFSEALVHHLVVPNGTLAQTAAYAACYIWGALFLANYSFARREL